MLVVNMSCFILISSAAIRHLSSLFSSTGTCDAYRVPLHGFSHHVTCLTVPVLIALMLPLDVR